MASSFLDLFMVWYLLVAGRVVFSYKTSSSLLLIYSSLNPVIVALAKALAVPVCVCIVNS